MSKKRKSSKIAPRTTAEWVSLVISLLLLGAVVGVVIKLWVSETKEPAQFKIEVGAARNDAGQYYLPFTLTNEGDQTAAEVMVEGRINAADNEETSSTTFDFIPGHARQEGVLIFSGDPATAQLRVASFQRP
ncbi:MAG TPA: TIGR02588 family protein [Blastocatellia bacterium]|nr:TIGR02588 family protein [Blastocatellia bacterium]